MQSQLHQSFFLMMMMMILVVGAVHGAVQTDTPLRRRWFSWMGLLFSWSARRCCRRRAVTLLGQCAEINFLVIIINSTRKTCVCDVTETRDLLLQGTQSLRLSVFGVLVILYIYNTKFLSWLSSLMRAHIHKQEREDGPWSKLYRYQTKCTLWWRAAAICNERLSFIVIIIIYNL